MGLLDLLGIGGTKEERETRSVRKLQKKAVEKYGPKENRQGAIEELGEMRTPRAVEALLMRYTVRVEPGITDDEEKQRVLAAQGSVGPVARGGGGRVPGRGAAQGSRRIQPGAGEEGLAAPRAGPAPEPGRGSGGPSLPRRHGRRGADRRRAGHGGAEGRAGPRAAHPALPPRPPGQQRAGPRSPGESSGRHPFRREGLHAEDGGLPARLVQARLEGPGGPEELA